MLYRIRKIYKISLLKFITVSVILTFLPIKAAADSLKKVIRFVYSEWAPVFFLDNNQNSKGLFAEIVQEMFEKRLGFIVKYQALLWKRAQNGLRIGSADFTIMLPTEEQKDSGLYLIKRSK